LQTKSWCYYRFPLLLVELTVDPFWPRTVVFLSALRPDPFSLSLCESITSCWRGASFFLLPWWTYTHCVCLSNCLRQQIYAERYKQILFYFSHFAVSCLSFKYFCISPLSILQFYKNGSMVSESILIDIEDIKIGYFRFPVI